MFYNKIWFTLWIQYCIINSLEDTKDNGRINLLTDLFLTFKFGSIENVATYRYDFDMPVLYVILISKWYDSIVVTLFNFCYVASINQKNVIISEWLMKIKCGKVLLVYKLGRLWKSNQQYKLTSFIDKITLYILYCKINSLKDCKNK